MPRKVLTDRTLKTLKPAPKGKRLDVMDAVVPGFGVRVTDKADAEGRAAQRTFILVPRYPGSTNPTRRALGEYGRLSLEQARDKARAWHALIGKGIDPAEQEKRTAEARRQAAEGAQANSFGVVTEDYLKRHVSKQRRAADVERIFRNELLPIWADKPLSEISRRDVVTLVDSIVDRGATYQAHNVLGQARTFFNWAINRGIYGLEISPCDRLKPAALIGSRDPRQRILNDAEIAALWRATEALAYPYGSMYRMLLLTGQRKAEVAAVRWSEIDLDKHLWSIPAERFKSKAAHLVPLSADVVAFLQTLPRFANGDSLFSSSYGRQPVKSFAKAKERLDAVMVEELGAAPPEWVIHDVRRTVRTNLSALRIPEPIAEMVIGHARKGLAGIYDQHKYLDEMREALELWAGRLRDIVTPPPETVVPIRGAR
jgi:integrase